MITFELGGFGGLKDNIKLKANDGKILLFGGKNGSGKTSIKEACEAVLTMNQQPDGVAIKDCVSIINDQKGFAFGNITLAGKSRRIAWLHTTDKNGESKGSCETENKEGLDYIATGIAVQDIRFGRLSPTERVKELLKWTDAKITKKDIKEYLNVNAHLALPEQKPDEPEQPGLTLEKLFDSVKVLGCESAFKTMNNDGKNLQAKFQELTGTKWGSDKGGKWMPANLACAQDAFEKLTEDGIKNHIERRQEELEDAIADEAISKFEGERLAKVAEALPAIVIEYTKLQEASKNYEGIVQAKEEAVKKLKSVHSPDVLVVDCEHCHKEQKLILLNGKLRPAGDAPKNKEDALKKMTAAQAELDEIRGDHGAIVSQMLALGSKKHECEMAQKAIDEHTAVAAKANKKGTKHVDEARLSLDNAKLMLAQFATVHKARALDKEIKDNKAIQAMLAPDGLQQDKMGKALTKFNADMDSLAAIAKWPSVRVDADMTMTYGGRTYKRISKGEKARADLMVQVHLAKLAKDVIVLVDDFEEVVGKEDRGAAVKLLNKTGTTALVFMAVGSEDQMPNLPEAVGQTFWVEGGKVRDMAGVYA